MLSTEDLALDYGHNDDHDYQQESQGVVSSLILILDPINSHLIKI